MRSEGGRRLYAQVEIAALREALHRGLAIESAVSVARDSHAADASALVAALEAFGARGADDVIDGSLALRTLEETIDQVVLPALRRILSRDGATSTAWAFAVSWAEDWMLRARRLAARSGADGTVLIGDATVSSLDPLRPYAHAVLMCCARLGLSATMLSTGAPKHAAEMVAALRPDVLVVVGRPGDAHALWSYQVSPAAGGLATFWYDGLSASGTFPRTSYRSPRCLPPKISLPS